MQEFPAFFVAYYKYVLDILRIVLYKYGYMF